ncbi:hypothetical protein ES319_D06G067700v1 [Gossypium barbadense]|uniref:Uncharacterized protein n=2 Tax=Gossypium TaxID=3633 RepID=A0A5J5R5J9_GOSBA|nr:hypothetical protein ES319_D06G067700v1 [Gossypium barbadense]TYG63995.1 hypothetical protein ES288_D06G073100v1 [Gossypium darwinii]
MVVCRFMSSCPNSFWVLISPRAHAAMLITRTNLLLPCIPTQYLCWLPSLLEEMNFWPPCARSHPLPLLALALLHYQFMAGFEGHKRVEAWLFNYSFVFPLRGLSLLFQRVDHSDALSNR